MDERTIDRVLNDHNAELTQNEYQILKSINIRKFKNLAGVDDTNVVDIDPKVPQLGIFSFRAFLNLAMLITNSDRARELRSRILDIVTQVVFEKAGDTTFINQRDEDYWLQSGFPTTWSFQRQQN